MTYWLHSITYIFFSLQFFVGDNVLKMISIFYFQKTFDALICLLQDPWCAEVYIISTLDSLAVNQVLDSMYSQGLYKRLNNFNLVFVSRDNVFKMISISSIPEVFFSGFPGRHLLRTTYSEICTNFEYSYCLSWQRTEAYHYKPGCMSRGNSSQTSIPINLIKIKILFIIYKIILNNSFTLCHSFEGCI